MAGRLLTVAVVTLVLSSLFVTGAGAIELPIDRAHRLDIYTMVFPVEGESDYEDTWGACRGSRCSRSHEGTDIMAAKMTPVVAVASGTVGWIHNRRGGKCCALAINHDDGWRSWYIHLNNDTPGTDDGRGWGFAKGIKSGARVEAGQLIGYVGDSGNAEDTPAHLHFELERPDGTEINPYEHLCDAQLATLLAFTPFATGRFVNIPLWAGWFALCNVRSKACLPNRRL